MILPSPPNDHEKYLYVDQNKWLIYGWGLVSFLLLVAGMAIFAVHHNYFVVYVAFTIITAFYLGVSYWIGVFGKPFDLTKHEDVRRNTITNNLSVDVYLPSCGEPLEVLENTYRHVRALRWPEGKLHVWVLDDSHRTEVAMLADRFEFNYIARPNRGELKKAGNVRYAFARTTGELILILDADFCPRPDMLEEMVPYFNRDAGLAIVQSPQYFELKAGQSWVEKGAAYVQELFYRMVQTNRDTWGASICVGTCALYRRAALAPHGGTYPIAYSEDLHTGWQAIVDRWRVKYLPLNLAKGICPETMSAYWVQQTRWCTGSTSLLLSKKFWTTPLPSFMTRLCYISGMFYYVATALSVILTPLPALIVVWFHPENVFWYNYLFSLPSFIFGVLIVAMWGRAPFGAYVLSARQVSYYAHLFALWDKLKGSMVAWVPTGDTKTMKSVRRYLDFKRVMFFWVSITTALAFAGAFYRMDELSNYNFYPLLFFSGFHYWVSMRAFSEES